MTAPTARQLRADALAGKARADQDPLAGARREAPFRSELRAELVDWEGKRRARIEGYASVVDIPYQMWDMFGEYDEVIVPGAFDETLAAGPDVAFLLNHRGMTMARTANRSLELWADARGLGDRAYVNPERSDVADLLHAIDDGVITEQSFAFWITDYEWRDDFSTFAILKVDLDRGDVSAVNYGANPYTNIAGRAHGILDALEHLPAGAARAAMTRLQGRTDVPAAAARAAALPAPAPVEPGPGPRRTGRSVSLAHTEYGAVWER